MKTLSLAKYIHGIGRYFIYPHYTDEYKTRLNVNVPNYYKPSTCQNRKKITI